VADERRDLPIADAPEPTPTPVPVTGGPNGSGEHESTDASLFEFWQEFKERR
jgi:hypothetical protein